LLPLPLGLPALMSHLTVLGYDMMPCPSYFVNTFLATQGNQRQGCWGR
jgi:hypothetical protein